MVSHPIYSFRPSKGPLPKSLNEVALLLFNGSGAELQPDSYKCFFLGSKGLCFVIAEFCMFSQEYLGNNFAITTITTTKRKRKKKILNTLPVDGILMLSSFMLSSQCRKTFAFVGIVSFQTGMMWSVIWLLNGLQQDFYNLQQKKNYYVLY